MHLVVNIHCFQNNVTQITTIIFLSFVIKIFNNILKISKFHVVCILNGQALK
jgi:hypothetical protein